MTGLSTEILMGIIGVLWTLLLMTNSFFMKKTLKKIESTIETHDLELRKTSELRAADAVNGEITQSTLQEMKQTLAYIKEEIKELRKIDVRLQILQEQIIFIPEMRKDIDAYHGLIRDVKNNFQSYLEQNDKLHKGLRQRTHFIMNKLAVIKGMAETKGWKFQAQDWSMPSLDD